MEKRSWKTLVIGLVALLALALAGAMIRDAYPVVKNMLMHIALAVIGITVVELTALIIWTKKEDCPMTRKCPKDLPVPALILPLVALAVFLFWGMISERYYEDWYQLYLAIGVILFAVMVICFRERNHYRDRWLTLYFENGKHLTYLATEAPADEVEKEGKQLGIDLYIDSISFNSLFWHIYEAGPWGKFLGGYLNRMGCPNEVFIDLFRTAIQFSGYSENQMLAFIEGMKFRYTRLRPIVDNAYESAKSSLQAEKKQGERREEIIRTRNQFHRALGR
jgi:hypothetical protein